MYRLVLFDVVNTLVVDSKDVSEYVSESIRNIYGRIVQADLKRYEGQSSQNIAEDILRHDKMPEEEIKSKLNRYMEDLFYTYYNVAGHDRLILVDGARDLLGQIWKKDIAMGIVTGEAERIAKFRAEKTTIHGFFKMGAYGNDGKEPSDIVNAAIKRAKSDLGIESGGIAIVASSPYLIKAAKRCGVAAIGIANAGYSESDLKAAGADLVVRSPKDKGKIVGFLK
jgi:phosphoglycolate phosphatase-like HAD superfamily hydrolase